MRNGKHIFFYIDISLEDGYKLDNKDNRTIKQLPQKVCRTKTAFKNVYFWPFTAVLHRSLSIVPFSMGFFVEIFERNAVSLNHACFELLEVILCISITYSGHRNTNFDMKRSYSPLEMPLKIGRYQNCDLLRQSHGHQQWRQFTRVAWRHNERKQAPRTQQYSSGSSSELFRYGLPR